MVVLRSGGENSIIIWPLGYLQPSAQAKIMSLNPKCIAHITMQSSTEEGELAGGVAAGKEPFVDHITGSGPSLFFKSEETSGMVSKLALCCHDC